MPSLQVIDDKDEFMYLGTRTGDVLQVPYFIHKIHLFAYLQTNWAKLIGIRILGILIRCWIEIKVVV